ncbi:hypothetical protein [Brevundimonas sp.]|uniref:hypothetical protein n=1 Tax=Brevundimonas sp. TaxID=1871086 RepID=UPI003BAB8366
MWGIVLTNAAGEAIDQFVFDGPIEGVRDGCRRHLEARPDATQARLVSPDGLLDYVYPERPGPLGRAAPGPRKRQVGRVA